MLDTEALDFIKRTCLKLTQDGSAIPASLRFFDKQLNSGYSYKKRWVSARKIKQLHKLAQILGE